MTTVLTANVIYTNHQGERTNVTVNVKRSFAYADVEKPTHYSAFNFDDLGYGKPDRDPIGAIHRLMGDHGNVIAIQTINSIWD
tara:strand:+ start:610 stop:858 length:249 start_codon:yes stop_codon:yes gene_type:complete